MVVRAKTLFATHYHELTTLADHLDRVYNVHVAADESDGDVTFLRTVREGPTDRSYGIHVADLAGVPDPVVDRSRDVLEKLREEKAIEAKGGSSGEPVQAVFDLEQGEFTADSDSGGDSERGTAASSDTPATADGGEPDPEAVLADEFGEGVPEVLETLADIDVNETPPVELMAKVQEWQEQLDEE